MTIRSVSISKSNKKKFSFRTKDACRHKQNIWRTTWAIKGKVQWNLTSLAVDKGNKAHSFGLRVSSCIQRRPQRLCVTDGCKST